MVGEVTKCFALSIDWSAWSAIATFAAAGIALYVGVVPMRNAVNARNKVAMSAVKLLLAEATSQSFYLGVATRFFEQNEVTEIGYKKALDFALRLDDKPFRDMIPYMDSLPAEVAECITSCAVVISTNLRLLNHEGTTRGPGPHVVGMAGSLSTVLSRLEDFRASAGAFTGYPPVNKPERQQDICDTIVTSSRAARG